MARSDNFFYVTARYSSWSVLTLCVLLLVPLLSQANEQLNELDVQQKVPKTVFIIVDGIPADVLEKANTPYIDEISAEGAYTHAYVGVTLAQVTNLRPFQPWDIKVYSPAHGPTNTMFTTILPRPLIITIGIFSGWLKTMIRICKLPFFQPG